MFYDVQSYLLQCPHTINHDVRRVPSSGLIKEEFYDRKSYSVTIVVMKPPLLITPNDDVVKPVAPLV
jgi:hypothetical protein